MIRRDVLWLMAAAAIPLLLWSAAPEGAEWAGTDDRVGEMITPAGRPMIAAPAWSADAERLLFLGQAGLGWALLAGSLWRMKSRGGRDS
jgi:ABC-type cobalt transport system substrate-binding protein